MARPDLIRHRKTFACAFCGDRFFLHELTAGRGPGSQRPSNRLTALLHGSVLTTDVSRVSMLGSSCGVTGDNSGNTA
jgi:hypothetical protein